MAMRKPAHRQPRYRRRVPDKCSFCETDITPNYKDTKPLTGVMTDKGKIVSRSRTGICQKHQRQISRAIKRSRYMSLLPFVTVLK